jgi:hypothetical protein
MLPRDWKVCGQFVFCQQCRRRRFRLRSITMPVLEPGESGWQELRMALGESWLPAKLRDGTWEARVVDGQPVIRARIAERWWELGLNSAWSAGQRAAYEKVASGAAAGELSLYRVPRDGTRHGNAGSPYSEIMCRMVVWLPREPIEAAAGVPETLPVRTLPLSPEVRHLEELGLADLREAIRTNRVSFPSQVPTFPKHDRPDLQRRLAQLYFVLGWSCSMIGERYRLAPTRVRQILNTWRCQAARTGYLQHIPPSEVISQLALAKAPIPADSPAAPDRKVPVQTGVCGNRFQKDRASADCR